jgi:hypothetical protein
LIIHFHIHFQKLRVIGLSLTLATTLSLPLPFLIPTTIQAQTNVTPQQVEDWIYAYSSKYDINPQIPLGVAACESLYFNTDVINNIRKGSLGEVGTFQFHPSGIWWETPQANADPPYSMYDPEANVAAATYLLSQGYGPKHWRTCYSNWRFYYNNLY